MTQTIDDATIWIVIVAMAVGSFALRFLFIGLVGGRSMPIWLLRPLRYAAVAILPALVAPLVIWPPSTQGQFDIPLGLAALLSMGASALTKNVVIGMAAGVLGYFGSSVLLG